MLNKNVLKTFTNKWFLIFSIGIVIFLSSFIYTMMSYAIDGLKKPTDKFLEEYKQEDFSCDMINTLTNNEIAYLQNKNISLSNIYILSDLKKQNKELFYEIIKRRKDNFEKIYDNYILELRETKDINYFLNNEEHNIKVIKNQKYINLPMYEEGNAPIKNNEVAITRIYAKKNNLAINDKILINEKEYNIVGFVLLPDYNLPLFNETFIIDNSKQGIFVFNDEEYDRVKGMENFYFSGIAKTSFNEKKFKNKVIEDLNNHSSLNYLVNIITTKNQLRSGAIYDELKGGRATTLTISVFIASIAIIIVSILIHQIINEQRGQIGVLKALGYTKKEIALPYLTAILLIVLPFLILGYYIGLIMAPYLKDFYLEIYILPSVPIVQDTVILMIAIIVPLAIFLILSYMVIIKMLSKKPLDLLRPFINKKVSRLSIYINKLLRNKKGQTKFKYSFIMKNLSRFFIFLSTIVFSSILILMALSLNGIYDKITKGPLEKVDYNYQAFVDPYGQIDIPSSSEKFIQYEDAIYKGDKITLMGLELDNKLYHLYNSNNEDITNKLKKGIIINESLRLKYHVQIGDKLNIEINDKKYEFTISSISNGYLGYKVYMDIKELSKKISNSDNESYFNGIFTKKRPSDDNYRIILNKNSIIEQSELMNTFMKYSILALTFSAILIAVIVILILTMLAVEDNYYNVSLLKVMGYNKKEVNSMILNSYLIYSVIGYLCSVPIAMLMFYIFELYFIEGYNLVFPLDVELWHILVGLGLILIIFYLGIVLAKRKINKISLQEVLKTYRE